MAEYLLPPGIYYHFIYRSHIFHSRMHATFDNFERDCSWPHVINRDISKLTVKLAAPADGRMFSRRRFGVAKAAAGVMTPSIDGASPFS